MSGMESLSILIALASLAVALHAEWRITKKERRDAVRWVAEPLISYGSQCGFIVRNVGFEAVKLAEPDVALLPDVRLDFPLPMPVRPGGSFEVKFIDDDWRQVRRELPIRWTDSRGQLHRGVVALPPRGDAPQQS